VESRPTVQGKPDHDKESGRTKEGRKEKSMGDVIVQGVCLGGIYALLALGFSIVFQASLVMNLAYGAQIMVVAYTAWWFSASVGAPSWAAILIAFVASTILSPVIEWVFIRRLQGRDLLSVLIATLMLGTLIRALGILVWGGQAYSYPFTPSGFYEIGPIKVLPAYLFAFIAALLVFVVLFVFFRYTKVGLGMRIVANSHVVAQSLGIKVRQLIQISWVASGLFAAFAAVLIGMTNMVTPDMEHLVLGKAMPVLLVGGLFSIPGTLVGGLLIGVAETLGGHFFEGWEQLIPWLFMLVILLIRPWGLLGKALVRRI
jgi:branched-chain amino acid transport system permease protein